MPEDAYKKILESFDIPEGAVASIASRDVSASKDDLFDDSHQLSMLIGRPTTPRSDSVRAALSK